MKIQTSIEAAGELSELLNDIQIGYLISIWDQKHQEKVRDDIKFIRQKFVRNRILEIIEETIWPVVLIPWIITIVSVPNWFAFDWIVFDPFKDIIKFLALLFALIMECVCLWIVWLKVEAKINRFREVEQRIRDRLEMINYLKTFTSYQGVRCTYTDVICLFNDRVYEKLCREKNGDTDEYRNLGDEIRRLNMEFTRWGILDGNLKPFFARAERKWLLNAASGEIMTDFQI